MDLSKGQLRKILKAKRHGISAGEVGVCSQKIIAKCIELIPWDKIKSLHTYVPVQAENEIDTWLLLEYVWENNPKILTYVPALNSNGEYDNTLVNTDTLWRKDGVRIPRPVNGKIISEKHKFDVIIVPMLGFDANGYRLGHGKGWYDRFLASQSQALTIGLCYQMGYVTQGVPYESHDIPLKRIITEYT